MEVTWPKGAIYILFGNRNIKLCCSVAVLLLVLSFTGQESPNVVGLLVMKWPSWNDLIDLPALQHTPATIWVQLRHTWVTVIILLTGMHWHFDDLHKREARNVVYLFSLRCLIADASVTEGSAQEKLSIGRITTETIGVCPQKICKSNG